MTAEDKLTIAQIYEELRLICFHVAWAVTKSHAMAEDAVHNAFLAVIKHREDIFALPYPKRKSRIIIITKNKAIDLLRTQSKIDPIDDAEEIADDLSLCGIIEGQDEYEHLISCISRLPALYQCAFELRYVHDMSNMEIAKILGITNKAVSTRIARAKAILRKMLI